MCHSLVAKRWIKEKRVCMFDCPASSPDFNQIENLWEILARQVYANQRQFEDVESLLSCIMETWRSITSNVLGLSMQKRCTVKHRP